MFPTSWFCNLVDWFLLMSYFVLRSRAMAALGLLLFACMSVQSQEPDADAQKPELLLREYPSIETLRLNDPNKNVYHVSGSNPKTPPWQPITAGKSDEQLVDQIEALRTGTAKPKFDQVHAFDLAGSPIVAADLSLDGKTLVIYDQKHRLTTWNLTNGKKLLEIPLETKGERASVAISQDGKLVVFGDESTDVRVFDTSLGGALIRTHSALNYPVAKVAISPSGLSLAAVDIKGSYIKASPKHPSGTEREKAFPDFDPQINLAVADHGNFAKSLDSEPEYRVDLRLGASAGSIDCKPGRASAVAATDRYLVATDRKDVRLMYLNPRTFAFSSVSSDLDVPANAARFDSEDQTCWLTTEAGIDIRVVQEISIGCQVRFPKTEAPIAQALVAPDAETLVLLTPEGKATVWKLKNNRAAAQAELVQLVRAMIEEDRYEALELLAKRWVDIDHDPYVFDEPPYLFLMNFLRRYDSPHFTQKPKLRRCHEFVIAHPDAELFRVILARMLMTQAWDARGRGFARSVDNKEWVAFHQLLEQVNNVLIPMFQREQSPCPEAYVLLMELAKVEQWPPEMIDYFLKQAQQHAPTYARIYGEMAVALMPRWGGAPTDSSDFAAAMADAVGGDAGDILYANIALAVLPYHGWRGTVHDLQFDVNRLANGFAQEGCRIEGRSGSRLCLALSLAHQRNNRQVARPAAAYLAEQGCLPDVSHWLGSVDAFEKVMRWGLNGSYSLVKLSPPKRSPKLPSEYELAQVDKIDAITRGTELPQWKKLREHKIGTAKPVQFDIAPNGQSMVTIDTDGNLDVWDVRTGENIMRRSAEQFGKQTAVAITPDSKKVVTGDDRGKWFVLDAETGKTLEENDGLKPPVRKVGASSDGQRFYAIGDDNEMQLIPKLVKDSWPVSVIARDNVPVIGTVAVGLGKFCTLQARRYEDHLATTMLMQDEERVAGTTGKLVLSATPHIAATGDYFALAAGDNLASMLVIRRKPMTTQTTSQKVAQAIREVYFTSNAKKIWMVCERGIDVRDWHGLTFCQPVALPPNVATEDIVLAPDAAVIVHFGENGTASLWKLEGDPIARDYYVQKAIIDLTLDGRFDTLELLGKRWLKDYQPGRDAPWDNNYSVLIKRINSQALGDGDPAKHEKWLRAYLEMHPDSQVARLALCHLLYWFARAPYRDKDISEVPEKIRETLQMRLGECVDILEPLLQEKDPPPETYAMMMRLARDLQWEPFAIQTMLSQAQTAHPTYARTFGEACMTFLPSHGGKPEEAEAYAAKVADNVGGDAGDLLYAQIAVYVAGWDDWPMVFDELGFSPERVLKGLVMETSKFPRPHLLRPALLLAQQLDDQEAGQKLATLIEEQQIVPQASRWPNGNESFDEAMTWANSK